MKIITAVAGFALAVGCAAGLAVPASQAAPASRADTAPRVPALNWRSCYDGFQCATAHVPLDYRHPDGSKISIAVIRHLATDPAHRLGSLFVNGGGPSAQVTGFSTAYSTIPAALRADFDIADFDPRGFGSSAPIQCYSSQAAENELLAPLGGMLYPSGARQISLWDRTWADLGAQCAKTAGPVLYHDGTADVARDMDLLRQAVGDPVLNFIGLSYATGIGATYANLFPDHVGHIVLDGNLDPTAWTSQGSRLPTWMRSGQDVATAAVIEDFLDLCGKASTQACAFSAGTPAATRAKYAALLGRLHQHPVTIGNPPQTFTDVITANSVPVGTVADWQQGAAVLQQLWQASLTTTTTTTTSSAAPAGSGTAYAGPEQALAMQCADSPNPRDLSAYPAAAQLALDRAGLVGPPQAWTTEPCATWPQAASQDRYDGPWNVPTASTILVIGNTGDPLTPYQSSVAMSRDLSRARLLTVNGYGHTMYQNPSTCALGYMTSYLVTGALPPAGTTCPQDAVPFPSK